MYWGWWMDIRIVLVFCVILDRVFIKLWVVKELRLDVGLFRNRIFMDSIRVFMLFVNLVLLGFVFDKLILVCI